MKNILKAMAITAGLLTPFTFANAGNFDGGFFQLTGGYEHNDSQSFNGVGTSGINTGLPITAGGSTSDNGTIGVGIGLASYVNSAHNILLGIGADYQPLRQTGSQQQVSINGVGQSLSTSIDVKERYNIYGILGYAFEQDKLGYLKLGYSSENAYLGISDASKDISGYIVGLGYKQAFTKHWHGLVEVNYMHYESTSFGSNGSGVNGNVSPEATNLLVGIEYKF